MSLLRIKYNIVTEALAGEIVCGDQYLVKELNDSILIAVADGLGHGEDAAFAAKSAMGLLDKHAQDSVERLVEICNHELTNTCGLALTIVRITNDNILTYLGIGNVTGVCWQQDESATLHKQSFFLIGGIVGYHIPSTLKSRNFPIKPGDILILATDGIKDYFEEEPPKLESPEKIAQQIFKYYHKGIDDSLVLVAKFI